MILQTIEYLSGEEVLTGLENGSLMGFIDNDRTWRFLLNRDYPGWTQSQGEPLREVYERYLTFDNALQRAVPGFDTYGTVVQLYSLRQDILLFDHTGYEQGRNFRINTITATALVGMWIATQGDRNLLRDLIIRLSYVSRGSWYDLSDVKQAVNFQRNNLPTIPATNVQRFNASPLVSNSIPDRNEMQRIAGMVNKYGYEIYGLSMYDMAPDAYEGEDGPIYKVRVIIDRMVTPGYTLFFAVEEEGLSIFGDASTILIRHVESDINIDILHSIFDELFEQYSGRYTEDERQFVDELYQEIYIPIAQGIDVKPNNYI